jgi:hypothetical protein
MGTKSNSKLLNNIPTMIDGLNTQLAGQTLTVNGVQIATKDAIAVLQRATPARTATANARAAWLAAVKANTPAIAAACALMVELHRCLPNFYGVTSPKLTAFGMKPKAVKPRTAAAKVATAVKAKATRLARNTMGPREKAAIHGAAPAPAPAAAPAAAAPVAGNGTATSK